MRDNLDVLFEPCPALKPILAREHELRISKGHIFGPSWFGESRADGAKARGGGGVAGVIVSQQFFGLFAKLLERRTGG
jgi:hypothetical protein